MYFHFLANSPYGRSKAHKVLIVLKRGWYMHPVQFEGYKCWLELVTTTSRPPRPQVVLAVLWRTVHGYPKYYLWTSRLGLDVEVYSSIEDPNLEPHNYRAADEAYLGCGGSGEETTSICPLASCE